jgi:hypothetical protein
MASQPVSNLIKNGSFETPVVANPCPNGGATNPTPNICTYFTGSTGISDWTVGGNSIDVFRMPTASPTLNRNPLNRNPEAGLQYVDLSGDAPGSLTQNINTLSGTSYTLQFYLHSNGKHSTGTGPIKKLTAVYWDGSQVALVRSVSSAWKVHDVTVTANSAMSTVEFADVTPNDGYNGPLLDAVSLVKHT